ncbi:methyltransferase domain-containing protein [Patescibacteria group bacterium]
MNKTLDFIKQVFHSKSIYRILFNWQVQEHCNNLTGICLDLAGGGNPSYYNYWFLNKSSKLVRTDFNLDKKPDMAVNLNQVLPFENNSMDNIFLFNAIYIIKEPERLIREINRVLKKDGRFFISSPFIFNEAKEPDDYRRLTSQGLEELFKIGNFNNFKIISFGERATSAIHLLHSFFIFNFMRLIIFTGALIFDKFVPKKVRKLHPCPLGYFAIAKK